MSGQENERPTVYIVDDNLANRELLADLMESVDLPCRQFESGDDLLERIEPDWRGCVLLDLRMPGLSGLEVQKILAGRNPDLPVILITAHGDVDTAVSALKSGAFDFIQKPINGQQVIDKVHAALRLADRLGEEARRRREIQTRRDALTPRERDVLGLMLDGAPNKRIASELGISLKTVEYHRANVMQKMAVHSLVDLVKAMAHLEGALAP